MHRIPAATKVMQPAGAQFLSLFKSLLEARYGIILLNEVPLPTVFYPYPRIRYTTASTNPSISPSNHPSSRHCVFDM